MLCFFVLKQLVSLCVSCIFSCFTAIKTTNWLVLKALCFVELLFANCENEFFSTIFAYECHVFHLNNLLVVVEKSVKHF